MNRIRTLVVDDEPLAGKLIASYVEKTPFLELTDLCLDGASALHRIGEGKAELVFCDIQMPDLTGMELSRMASSPRVKFIFTTAYAQYAIDGYKVSALDYLLKPVSYKDFLAAANRAREYFEAMGDAAAKESAKASVFLKVDGQMVKVDIDDILYVESVKDYVKVHCSDGRVLMSLVSLKKMAEILPEDRFFRVQRSFMVALDKVTAMERGRIIFGEEKIAVSDNVKDDFYKALSEKNIIFV
ncbi:MAG: response regulator transcription factor [Bacteroidales bacterium]|nr:response regulator transcription factor [Bacteroidales bacterium]